MTDQLKLKAPPAAPEEEPVALLNHAVPLVGSVSSVAVFATMSSTGGSRTRLLLSAGAFVVAGLLFMLTQWWRGRRQRALRVQRLREDYAHYLGDVRRQVTTAGQAQLRQAYADFPPIEAWLTAGTQPPIAGRDDRLRVRWGSGASRCDLELIAPDPASLADADLVCVEALEALVGAFCELPEAPLTVSLTVLDEWSLPGDDSAVRAFIIAAASRHGPDRLRIAVVTRPGDSAPWDWVKWLPHAESPVVRDAVGAARLVGPNPELLLAQAGDQQHHLVINLSDHRVAAQPGRTVIRPGHAAPDPSDTVDRCTLVAAESAARRLAARDTRQRGAGCDLLELLDPATPSPPLVVPIGWSEPDNGPSTPLWLDLRESAHGGVGPHGLLIGATGSGKSELLRTLVLALAMRHPSEELAMVLIDFKGGATFAGLADLPQVSALVTNLADDLSLVERMEDVLGGELQRRQELLSWAGCASRSEYEAARQAGRSLEPLPSLFVCIDEFSEMMSVRPEIIDLLVSIGRLGRSLGVHLLLASQRLEEGRLRGLEAHLSYRIGLRTFSASESRAVLGSPDAAQLPAEPGLGFFSSGHGELIRFRGGYVSGQLPPRVTVPTNRVLPFTAAVIGGYDPAPTQASDHLTVLDHEVDNLRHQPRAPALWLPGLHTSDDLPTLLQSHAGGRRARRTHPWRLLLGTVDLPREQRREAHELTLTGADGHLAIIGGPRAGKSTALTTAACSIALTSTPAQAHLYLLDFNAGSLRPLDDLPHTTVHAGPHHPEALGRTVAELERLVEDRSARGDDDDQPSLFVLIDGWGELRSNFEELAGRLMAIAKRGLGRRLHLVITTNRWADLRPEQQELFGSTVELRLGDPSESLIDRRSAELVPKDQPGRGLTGSGHHLLIATTDPGLPATISSTHQGRAATRLQTLPLEIALDQLLPLGANDRLQPVLGLGESTLQPLGWNTRRDPHLIVFGDSGSGRTSLLRSLTHQLQRANRPDQVQLLILDRRRTLSGTVDPAHCLQQAAGDAEASAAVAELATALTARELGWRGPEVFVLVDDYELYAGPAGSPHGNPLAPLLPLLPRATDIGLHLVLARRCGGAARALYDPIIQGLRDLDSPGLLLSGSPEEGPLLGSRKPQRLPPGRGTLVARGQESVVQLAWQPLDRLRD